MTSAQDKLFRLIRPALFRFDPEAAHRLALLALKLGIFRGDHTPDDPILQTRLWDLDFANPIGLAAGFDKGAAITDRMLALGFGFVEAGTVTPQPQPGNPVVRLFRLTPDEALINRLGFNSDGIDAFTKNLDRRTARLGIVGANVGKNRDTEDAAADYILGLKAVWDKANYLVINVSSPNTPGLRTLQRKDAMTALLRRAQEALAGVSDGMSPPPLLVKVGPDLSDEEIADIAEVAKALSVDGLIVGNTTVSRPDGLTAKDRDQTGGLSGKPLFPLATECLSKMFAGTGGQIPIIGCGGVASGGDAYKKIRAGASLVQLYSAFIFQGPSMIARVKRDLAACLKRDGFDSVSAAVGADHSNIN